MSIAKVVMSGYQSGTNKQVGSYLLSLTCHEEGSTFTVKHIQEWTTGHSAEIATGDRFLMRKNKTKIFFTMATIFHYTIRLLTFLSLSKSLRQ